MIFSDKKSVIQFSKEKYIICKTKVLEGKFIVIDRESFENENLWIISNKQAPDNNN